MTADATTPTTEHGQYRGVAFAVAAVAVVRLRNLKSPAQETAVPAIDRRAPAQTNARAKADAPSHASKSRAFSTCALGDA